MVKILTGPVVGMVTHHSVRLLLEVDTACKLTAVCTEAQNHDGSHITVQGIAFEARRPRAVTVDGLRSATEYMIEFVIDDSDVDSGGGVDDEGRPIMVHDEDMELENGAERVAQVATFGRKGEEHNDESNRISDSSPRSTSTSSWSHRIAIVSGNDQSKTDRTMWKMLSDRVHPNKMKALDIVIHTSGQVRGEEAFQEAKKLVADANEITEEQEKQIAEMYRELYRKNWNHEPIRRLLSTVSNLMMLGEMDICDGWGSQESHRSPESVDFKIAMAARRVYWEYQRQLWQDMPTDPEKLHESWGLSHEGYHCIFDALGVLFIDTVAANTFVHALDTNESEGFLTQKQIDESIKSKLSASSETFNDVSALMCVTATPIAFSPSDTNAFHPDDRTTLLASLNQWKSSEPSRNVLLISGSGPCGCHSIISYDGSAMDQLITSPICREMQKNNESIMDLNGKTQNIGSVTVTHRDICLEESLGVVDIFLSTDGKERTSISSFIIKQSTSSASSAVATNSSGWDIQAAADNQACCTIS